jgi:hypothetical protein
MTQNRNPLSALARVLLSTTFGGLASANVAQAQTIPAAAAPSPLVSTNSASVDLVTYRDPWLASVVRQMDIAGFEYKGFTSKTQSFAYEGGQVRLTYDKAPAVPYFVGRIAATGLKPNFAYQLKLMGKPERGSRGWGGLGDDWANEQLGKVGRWWTDDNQSGQTNFSDTTYDQYYKYAPTGSQTSIYGYLYMGVFVTDSKGNASIDFTGKSSYHITWAGWQNTNLKHVEDYRSSTLGGFPVRGYLTSSIPTIYYAYGSSAPSTSIRLFYEYEAGRPQNNVQLPVGKYRCRLLLTEESFHSNHLAYGGNWKSVLVSEDYQYGSDGAFLGADAESSNDVVFTIGNPQAPTAPTSLAATAATDGVSLSWTAVPGAYRYVIKRSTTKGGGYESLPARVYGNIYKDITADKSRYYVVTAVNSVGESLVSNEVTLPPATPTNLVAEVVSSGRIDLSWTDNSSNEDNFVVERSQDSSFPTTATVKIDASANGPQVSDVGLAESTTYYYRVRARNSAGDSAVSSAASAATLAPSSAGQAEVRAESVSSDQIALTWAPPSNNVEGYLVERAEEDTTTTAQTTPESALASSRTSFFRTIAFTETAETTDPVTTAGTTVWVKVATLDYKVTKFVDKGLDPETTYTYRVTASNFHDKEPVPSVPDAATTAPPVPPNAPENLTAKAISTNQINLSWLDKSTNEEKFEIEISSDGIAFSPLVTLGYNATTYSHTARTPNTTYHYRVTARNVDGSATSASANATTVPAAPAGLKATAGDAQVSLQWSAITGARYRVKRSTVAQGLTHRTRRLPRWRLQATSIRRSATVQPTSTWLQLSMLVEKVQTH